MNIITFIAMLEEFKLVAFLMTSTNVLNNCSEFEHLKT